MRYISLPENKYAIVDDEDFEMINQFKWRISDKGYAFRVFYDKDGKQSTLGMHRIINNTPAGFDTDHINRNKLDNRRSNLRSVNRSINNLNTFAQKNSKSNIRGVWFDNGYWRSQIKVNGKRICLGVSKDKNKIIELRKEAERKLICA